MSDVPLTHRQDLWCSSHARYRWAGRYENSHPQHGWEAILTYLRSSCHRIPSDVATSALGMVNECLKEVGSEQRNASLAHQHYWDGCDMLFILAPPHTGPEYRDVPVVKTVICLTDGQVAFIKQWEWEIEACES